MRRYIPGRALSRARLLRDPLHNSYYGSQTVTSTTRSWPPSFLAARCHVVRSMHTTQTLVPPASFSKAQAGPSQTSQTATTAPPELRDCGDAGKQLVAFLLNTSRE